MNNIDINKTRRKIRETKSVIAKLIFSFLIVFGLFWIYDGYKSFDKISCIEQIENEIQVVNSKPIDDSISGVVITHGVLNQSDQLVDETFGVKTNSVKLKRIVERYQWVEKEINSPSSSKKKRKYRYEKKWSSRIVNSDKFNRTDDSNKNPPLEKMPFKEKTQVSREVKLGDFPINGNALKSVITDAIIWKQEDTEVNRDIKGFKFTGVNWYSEKGNPNRPEVGDIRIRFEQIPTKNKFSVLALKQGSKLLPIECSEDSYFDLLPGELTKEELLTKTKDSAEGNGNKVLFIGGICLIFGIWGLYTTLTGKKFV